MSKIFGQATTTFELVFSVKKRRLLNSSLVGRPAAAAASLPLLRAPLALEVCGRKKDEDASRGIQNTSSFV
jgi:hypothetical protein